MKIGNLEIYGVIYKIENLVNGKVYIGQTIEDKGFDARYKNNLEKYTHNEHLKRSIKKYGIENFSINKIYDIAFSENELNIKEECWIKLHNSTISKYGYNKNTGGSNGSPNKETINKISKTLIGHEISYGTREKIKNTLTGRSLSEETKLKISKSNTGKGLGKKYSLEHRKKLSEIHKGIKQTEYTINKRIEHFKKEVLCLTTGLVFNSLKQAGEYYNCYRNHISDCCNNKRKHEGKLEDGTKLQWKFIKDLTIEEYIKYDMENKLKELELSNKDDSFIM